MVYLSLYIGEGGVLMNDTDIIELYFKRDENAIIQTKNKYQHKLNGLAFKIVRNSEDCEECVSDTYLKAWDTIPPQKPSFLFAYLAKICRFICFGRIDYNNAKKRSGETIALTDELLECIPSDLSEISTQSQMLKEVLENFLDSLSEEKRLIFMRRYWFFDSVTEIAKRFNISESKVKTSLFRTRAKLKLHLEKEGIKV